MVILKTLTAKWAEFGDDHGRDHQRKLRLSPSESGSVSARFHVQTALLTTMTRRSGSPPEERVKWSRSLTRAMNSGFSRALELNQGCIWSRKIQETVRARLPSASRQNLFLVKGSLLRKVRFISMPVLWWLRGYGAPADFASNNPA